MAMTKQAIVYHNQYYLTHYESLNLTLPKGNKRIIKEASDRDGLSMSQYILCAIRYYEKHQDKHVRRQEVLYPYNLLYALGIDVKRLDNTVFDAISNAVKSIQSARDRELVRIYYEENRPLKDFYETYGISQGRASEIKARALRKLRLACMEDPVLRESMSGGYSLVWVSVDPMASDVYKERIEGVIHDQNHAVKLVKCVRRSANGRFYFCFECSGSISEIMEPLNGPADETDSHRPLFRFLSNPPAGKLEEFTFGAENTELGMALDSEGY